MGNIYIVKILSPNSKMLFRGRVVRTPVEFNNVYEKELDALKSQIHKNTLNAEIFKISEGGKKENISKIALKKQDTEIVKKRSDGTVTIEELYDPKNGKNSLIERLIEVDKR